MIDLRANPFFLTEEQCALVEEKKRGLTTEEKTGQLIHCVSAGDSGETLLELYRKIPFGGLTFRAAPNSPLTGDSSRFELWLALLAVSMSGAAGLFLSRMKKGTIK